MRQEAFCLFKQEAVSAFRVNPKKVSRLQMLIPLTTGALVGFWEISRYATGLVYSQGLQPKWWPRFKPSPSMKVLDLAAAPGEKSTQLADIKSRSPGLQRNSGKRAKIYRKYGVIWSDKRWYVDQWICLTMARFLKVTLMWLSWCTLLG